MSGLLRNLLTLLAALQQQRGLAPGAPAVARFLVTPFDVGISTLKSDKYLQLVESAQLDFVVKAGIAASMLRGSLRFVNGSLLMRFARPVRLWDRVQVHTRVEGADARWAWFRHDFHVRGELCAQVWVKMKFKRGRLTVAPAEVLGQLPPPPVLAPAWDAALDQAVSS